MNQLTSTSSENLLSISKIQEQLYALNRKMDIILGKLSNNSSLPKPGLSPKTNYPSTSANQPTTIHPPSKEKTMYQVVCADCKKNCSIPFKPTADRPVYCKECFALRRSGQPPKVAEHADTPKLIAEAAPVKTTKKPVVKKKTAPKKTTIKKVVIKKKTITKKRK